MSQTILDRLDHLRREQRRVVRISGWLGLSLTLLILLLIAGTLDAVFHLDDPGVRLIELIGILLAGGWIAWTRLIRPLSKKPSDVELALVVERRFPGLRDVLSSAAQFEESRFDSRLGSTELQQDLTRRMETELETVSLEEILDRRPLRRTLLAATFMGTVCGIVAAGAPEMSTLALKRLAFPFAAQPWPRQYELQLVDRQMRPIIGVPGEAVRRVQGEVWELCVINRNESGGLPSDLQLLTRGKGEGEVRREAITRSAEIRSAANADSSQTAGVIKLTIRDSMELCVIGGDDLEEEWLRVEAVPPPLIEEFQLEIQPPGYLQQPRITPSAGQGKIEVLAGSKIRFTAKSNRPLASFRIEVQGNVVSEGKSEQASENETQGLRWSAEWALNEAGTFPWQWSLRDLEGFSQPAPPKFEVTVIADQPPEVRLDQPAADLRVTPQAAVGFKVSAKDDLGLQSLVLHGEVTRGGMSTDPKGEPPANAAPSERPLALPPPPVKSAVAEPEVNLSEYSLTPGDHLTVTFHARDAFPGPPEHLTKSAPRRIFIVSPQEKLRELADAQSALLNDLERAGNLQSEARNQVRDLQRQLENAAQLRPQDRDLLQRTEMQQRQVASELNLPGSGIASRAEELMRQYGLNQLTDEESTGKLRNLVDELQKLGRDQFPQIEDALTQARKQTGSGSAPPEKNKPQEESSPKDTPQADSSEKPAEEKPSTASTTPLKSLAEAEEQQSAAQGKLRELVQDLTEWRDQRYAARQVEEIIAAQEQTAKETGELSQRTLGKGMESLTPQDEADLARTAERQRQHAERFEQLQQQLKETLSKRADPEQGETQSAEGASELEDFLEQAEKLGTLPLMKGASRDINSNQLGEAGKSQQESLEQLQQLADILRDRPEQNTDKLVEQLRDAQQQLKDLRDRQAKLRDQTGKLESLTDPQERDQQFDKASREQSKLQEQAERLERRLNRMQAEDSGKMLGDAADRMRQAEKSLKNEVAPNAQEQQEQAEESLESAQKRLDMAQREMEQRQAREKIATVRDVWKGLLTVQKEVQEQTEKLNSSYEEKKQWNRVQLKALSELATKQNQLAEAAGKTSELVAAAKILSLSLKRSIQSMEGARDLLADRQTGKLTQDAQVAAHDRLKQILDAFEQQQQKEQDQANQPPPGGEGGEQPEQQGEQPAVPPLAELKILRGLQQELNDRTDALSQELAKAPDNAATLNDELNQLGQEQEELLQLLTETLEQLQQQSSPTPQPAPIPNAPQKDPIGNQPAASLFRSLRGDS